MADYYNTARAHVKALKTMQEDNKRKAERRAEAANVQAELPQNILRVDGRPSRMKRNQEQYMAIESKQGMIPWNGQQDNLIDRFDGRALLDFYREPDAQSKQQRKSEDEIELDEMLTFESFRDLVRLMKLHVPEEVGILMAEDENIAMRAAAKSDAAGAAGGADSRQNTMAAAGSGRYGAVGFSYGSGAQADASSGSDDSGSDFSDEDDEADGDEATDALAANLGIDNFTSMQRRAERLEEAERLGKVIKPKRRFSRKKAAARAKRMAGQGIDAFAAGRDKFKDSLPIRAPPVTDYSRSSRRGSPSYDAFRRSRSRSRSKSRSPHRKRESRQRAEFITQFEFSGKASRPAGPSAPASRPSASFSEKRETGILEALPDRLDPAGAGGPVALPAAGATMHGVRPSDVRWGSRHDDRYDSRGRDRDRGHSHHASRAPSKPEFQAPLPAAEKETPMQRMKRLRAAQLNTTIQKDSLGAAQKKANEERDRQARAQIERSAREQQPRSPSPGGWDDRYSGRSSPPRSRHRSRSPGHRPRY